MAVAELCKRLCRYLLHRYLGPFLEEKVALDQLHLSLDKGTGCVTHLTLDAACLNESFAKYHLPFQVLDGYIGSVTIHLPVAISTASLSSVLSLSSETIATFQGLRLELSDVQFTIRGKDAEEVVIAGDSLDLLATSLCASEFASASQSLAVDYSQSEYSTGINLPLEGLDQLASIIDSIVSQVEIVVKDLLIRLEPASSAANDNTLAALELHLSKASGSFSAKSTSKEFTISLSDIEIRAESFLEKEGDSSDISESSYTVLLRIPDANVSLSTSTSLFTAKVLSSSVIALFPGPTFISSVIAMLDSILGRKSIQKNMAVYENSTPVDPVMFESCSASNMSSFVPHGETYTHEKRNSSPCVKVSTHIGSVAVVIPYSNPTGSLTPESLSVGFFASLPSSFECSVMESRNQLAKACPVNCLIAQLGPTTSDMVFNAHQRFVLDPEESMISEHPLRLSLNLSTEEFLLSDCVRSCSSAESSQSCFVSLLSCVGNQRNKIESRALDLTIRSRLTGFNEVNLTFEKQCTADFHLLAILTRLVPFAQSVVFPVSSTASSSKSSFNGVFTIKFEQIGLKLRFPKYPPLSFLGNSDEFTLHNDYILVDAEQLNLQLSMCPSPTPFASNSRHFTLSAQAVNACLQQGDTAVKSLIGANHLKVDFGSGVLTDDEQVKLFADPPLRLHNGREMHVPTQAHLKFQTSKDSVSVEVGPCRMSLPSPSLVTLLVNRFKEFSDLMKVFGKKFKEKSRTTTKQNDDVIVEESTGESIYYSMTSSDMAHSDQSTLKHTKKKTQFSLRCETLLVSAQANPESKPTESNVKRDLYGPNAVALVATDFGVQWSAKSGWLRVGSLSLLDAFAGDNNCVTHEDVCKRTPVLRTLHQYATVSASSTSHSVSSSADSERTHLRSQMTNQSPAVLFVWQQKRSDPSKKKMACRLSNLSLDLSSRPGKLPSSILILSELAKSFNEEFGNKDENAGASTNQGGGSLKPNKKDQAPKHLELCVEGSSLSLMVRAKSDDIEGITLGSKHSSLPAICLSIESVLFDAGAATAKPVPGQPPAGDMWLGFSNSVLEIVMKSGSTSDDTTFESGRRERMLHADWLELAFGVASSTSFVEVSGSCVALSTSVQNLATLRIVVAALMAGIFNASALSQSNDDQPGEQNIDFSEPQRISLDTPFELRDAMRESSMILDGNESERRQSFSSINSRRTNSGSSGGKTDVSEDGFLVLSPSLKLPKQAECRRLNNQPLKTIDNFLAKPNSKPDPLWAPALGWPTPVFRLVVRDVTFRAALLTERGDSLELSLVRTALRYERCPDWTPHLYRISLTIQDVEIVEQGLNRQVGIVCSRLVADDVPRLHSVPQVTIRMGVVRPNCSAVPLLQRNSAVCQDAECDLRVSIQPIRIKATTHTLDLVSVLTNRLILLCQHTQVASASSTSSSNQSDATLASSPPPGFKSPNQHLASQVGRGAPVLFDETQQRSPPNNPTTPVKGGNSGSGGGSGATNSGGLFIRSFVLQPSVIVELNFHGAAKANVPIHLDKCRLVLPGLQQSRTGFADMSRLLEFVGDNWKKSLRGQKSAFVTAGTGLNRLTNSAQELFSAASDLAALVVAPFAEDLPPAMTAEAQLRPGRILRGLTSSAASLSADVVVTVFRGLQKASSTASGFMQVPVPMPLSPELRSASNSLSSVSSQSRERIGSQSQDDAYIRKVVTSALLAGQRIETVGTIFAKQSPD